MALYQYKKALSLEPYNPVVMTKVARIFFEEKDYSSSEKLLLDCINVNPNYVSAYELLFEVYYTMAQFDKIGKIYDTILEINPFNYKIRKLYAEICADLGKIKDAIREYTIVKILNPSDKDTQQILNSLEEYLKIKEGKK
jgi:tetratricopeptide (TPR) repeat protein